VTGEVTEPRFGLDRTASMALAARTGLVINAAASVNFREPLDQALRDQHAQPAPPDGAGAAANAPLVQVSTCYVNGYRRGDMREETVIRPGAPRSRAAPTATTRSRPWPKACCARSSGSGRACGRAAASRSGWRRP
jgi:fatty acyl-CoA reductase